MSRSRAGRLELLAAVTAMLVIAVATFQPVFRAGFSLVDDHEILSYNPTTIHHPEVGPPSTLADRIVGDVRIGRARPLYWVIRFAEIELLGDSPLIWHALYVLLGVASAGFLFSSLRAMGVGRVGAFVAATWLLVTPGISSVWRLLGPQESLGTLFMTIAIWAAVRGGVAGARLTWRWNTLYVGATLAAMLTKESFILTVPALVGFRLFVYVRRRGRASLKAWATLSPSVVVLILSGADLLATTLIAKVAGTASYGGQFLSLHDTDLEVTLFNVAELTVLGGFALFLPLLAAVLDGLRGRFSAIETRDWAWGVGLFVLLLVPQLVLYRHGSGFTMGRYMLPTGLGVAMALAGGITWLSRDRRMLVCGVLILLCGVIIGRGALATWQETENFRADTAAVDGLVTRIVESAPKNATVQLAINHTNQVELGFSLIRQIAYRGRDDIDVRAVVLPPPDARQAPSPDLVALVKDNFPERVDDQRNACSRAWGVVLLAAEQMVKEYLPCFSDSTYQRAEFPSRVLGTYGGDYAYTLLALSEQPGLISGSETSIRRKATQARAARPSAV